MAAWILPAAKAIAQTGTSILNTVLSNRANMKMAKYAYSKDLEMWNRQNAYNTPTAQMARLKGSGLNPNIVYGSGTVAGNTGSQMPKYNAPTLKYDLQAPDIGGQLTQFQDFKMRQAQTDNVKAQTRKTNVETSNAVIKGLIYGKQNTKLGLDIYGEGHKEDMTEYTDSPYLRKIIQGLEYQATKIEGSKLDNEFKNFKANLSKDGINVNDNILLRMAFMALKKQGVDPMQITWDTVQELIRIISLNYK